MRQVIGISETVYDILFRDGQPIAGVPGGSVFNGLISLGRLGVRCSLISEVGTDRVGECILNFLHENGVGTEGVLRSKEKKSAISLAYLNHKNDAEYSFYKDYDNARLEFSLPEMEPDDVLMFGSYYVLNPLLRQQTQALLQHARERGAILYYDLNFRGNHKSEAARLMPAIQENFEFANVVRGSSEDFETLYGETRAEIVYEEKVRPFCKNFIYTKGSESVEVFCGDEHYTFTPQRIATVSTVGAGDNFNAGFVYGLIREAVTLAALESLQENGWSKLMQYAMAFGTEVCRGLENSIGREFAQTYRLS